MIKKNVSLIVVLCLLIGITTMFPTNAGAATGGAFGNNLTWNFEAGVLTISGTGVMDNFIFGTVAPWDRMKVDIKKVIVEDGVKNIGAGAFSGCWRLKEVYIGNSVTTIGKYAFQQCDLLTELTIPDSVTTIEDNAFAYCYTLAKVKISSNIKTIGRYAFSGCRGLTELSLPEGLTTIGEEAFSSCEGLTTLNIPKSVTHIGDWAFERCWGLTSVNIPDTITNVDRIFSSETRKFVTKYDPEGITMYSPDGEEKIVSKNAVEFYTNMGWYKIPMKKLYATDGRTVLVEKAQVEDYVKVGWYTNFSDVVSYIYYSNGENARVFKSEVPQYAAYGWSTTPLSFQTSSKLPITFTDSENSANSVTIKDFYISGLIDYDHIPQNHWYRLNGHLYGVEKNTTIVQYYIEYTQSGNLPMEILYYDTYGNLIGSDDFDPRGDNFYQGIDGGDNPEGCYENFTVVPKATASLIVRAKTDYANPVYYYNEHVTLFSSSGDSIYVPNLHSSAYYPEYTYGTIMYDKDGNEVGIDPLMVDYYVSIGYYKDYPEYLYYTSFKPNLDKLLNNKAYDSAYAWVLYHKNIFTKYDTVVKSRFTQTDLPYAKSMWQSNSACPVGLVADSFSSGTKGVLISLKAMTLSDKKVKSFKVSYDTYIDNTFYKTLTCKVDNRNYSTDTLINDGYWGTNLKGDNVWIFSSSEYPDTVKINKAENCRVVEVTFEDGTKWIP